MDGLKIPVPGGYGFPVDGLAAVMADQLLHQFGDQVMVGRAVAADYFAHYVKIGGVGGPVLAGNISFPDPAADGYVGFAPFGGLFALKDGVVELPQVLGLGPARAGPESVQAVEEGQFSMFDIPGVVIRVEGVDVVSGGAVVGLVAESGGPLVLAVLG